MNGAGFDGPLVLALVVFAGAIGGTALLVVTSARAANRHVTNATAFNAGPPAIGAGSAAGAGAAPAARALAGGLPAPPTDDETSRAVFAQLNEYYAANVMQGNTIFWTSLLSMSVGFAFVFFGLAKAGTNATVAIVSGVAGVLSQFIAATFLVALRSTQQQSTTYAQTLVDLRVHDVRAAAEERSIALGIALLNDISGDDANGLANRTRAAIAVGLIVKDPGVPPAPSAPVVEVDAGDGPPRGEPRGRVPTISADESRPTPAP